jgi:hypothetical protein
MNLNKEHFFNNDIITYILTFINDSKTILCIIQTSKIFHKALLSVTDIIATDYFSYLTLFDYCPNIQIFSLDSYKFENLDSIMYEIFNNCKISHLKIVNCEFSLAAEVSFIDFLSKTTDNDKLLSLTIDNTFSINDYFIGKVVGYNNKFTHIYLNNFEDLDPPDFIEYCLESKNIFHIQCNKFNMSYLDSKETRGPLFLTQWLNTYRNTHYNIKKSGNTSLKSVNLSKCNQGKLNFVYTMELLSYATELTFINFSDNNIDGDHDNICYWSLKRFKKLQTLDLRGNPIDDVQIISWRHINPQIEILF